MSQSLFLSSLFETQDHFWDSTYWWYLSTWSMPLSWLNSIARHSLCWLNLYLHLLFISQSGDFNEWQRHAVVNPVVNLSRVLVVEELVAAEWTGQVHGGKVPVLDVSPHVAPATGCAVGAILALPALRSHFAVAGLQIRRTAADVNEGSNLPSSYKARQEKRENRG